MDKIDKIRQEIERRIENYWSDGNIDSVVVSGELEELIDFINSLPEEDPSEDLEKAAEEYRRESYRKSVLPNIDGPTPEYGGNIKTAFIAGAQWMEN